VLIARLIQSICLTEDRRERRWSGYYWTELEFGLRVRRNNKRRTSSDRRVFAMVCCRGRA
jgi:hypothetical protein